MVCFCVSLSLRPFSPLYPSPPSSLSPSLCPPSLSPTYTVHVYVFYPSLFVPLPLSLPSLPPPPQEVDGETLLSLDPQMMVKLMDLKTGPALRIHRKITSLKKDLNITD